MNNPNSACNRITQIGSLLFIYQLEDERRGEGGVGREERSGGAEGGGG